MDNNITNNNNNDTHLSHNSSSTAAATSAATTTTSAANNNKDHFLRHLNKLSHKISKANLPSSNIAASSSSTFKNLPVEPTPPLQQTVHPPQQQQPPVYNINKSQFRDVVQKLTGSPAHASAPSQPPPIHAPKPASSRLQRIRPPPLAQLSTRPPSLLNAAINPLSPLPPLPTCHAAAESPISAYMRFLHSSVPSGSNFQQPQAPAADATAMVPPFGYFPSPKSPCPLLSPKLVFSPTGNGSLGFPQLPVSPTVPGVPSPKWRDL